VVDDSAWLNGSRGAVGPRYGATGARARARQTTNNGIRVAGEDILDREVLHRAAADVRHVPGYRVGNGARRDVWLGVAARLRYLDGAGVEGADQDRLHRGGAGAAARANAGEQDAAEA